MKDDKFKNADTLESLIKNTVSGLGTAVDPHSYSEYGEFHPLEREVIDTMYRKDWVAAKALDIPVKDMLRKWVEFKGLTEEQLKVFNDAIKHFQIIPKVIEGLTWGRLYGGAALIFAVKDSGMSDEEFSEESMGKGSLEFFQVFDRYELGNNLIETFNPMDPNFGKPEHYSIRSVKVHNTRVIRFEGVKLPRDRSAQTNYWGDSYLERIYNPALNSATIYNAVASMVHGANRDILKIKELFAQLSTGDCEAEKQLMKRLTLNKLTQSTWNMTLLDTEEELEQRTTNFSGVKELPWEYAVAVAGAADIPVTRFMGVSPAGLNSTGEGDLANYYDRLSSEQILHVAPVLDKVFNLILIHCFGQVPSEFDYEFNPLKQLSEKEIAEVQKIEAERDSVYVDSGIVPEYVVAKRLKEEGIYGDLSEEHIKELESFSELTGSEEESNGEEEDNPDNEEEVEEEEESRETD